MLENFAIEEPVVKYDLENRTREFAIKCRALVRMLLKDIPNREDGKQLVRSSGSVAANYNLYSDNSGSCA